jgi:hypothetical protein
LIELWIRVVYANVEVLPIFGTSGSLGLSTGPERSTSIYVRWASTPLPAELSAVGKELFQKCLQSQRPFQSPRVRAAAVKVM